MDYIGSEGLPIRETNDMCPNIAIFTLNKNNYGIPYVAENYPLAELVRTINSFILVKNLKLKVYNGASVSIGAILRKKGDGILVLDTPAGTSHVIAFIITDGKVTFYDANTSQLNKYLIKDDATILSFTTDFVKLFPKYTIYQVYIMEPNTGGKRKKTRRRTKKTRRHK